jgi:hypothetical protein
MWSVGIIRSRKPCLFPKKEEVPFGDDLAHQRRKRDFQQEEPPSSFIDMYKSLVHLFKDWKLERKYNLSLKRSQWWKNKNKKRNLRIGCNGSSSNLHLPSSPRPIQKNMFWYDPTFLRTWFNNNVILFFLFLIICYNSFFLSINILHPKKWKI